MTTNKPPFVDTDIACPGCGQKITVVLDFAGGVYSECGGEGEGGCNTWIAGDRASEIMHRAATDLAVVQYA